MVTLTAPVAGALYRDRSTGRIWHLSAVSAATGMARLSGSHYGPDCTVTRYVSSDELADDYTPAAQDKGAAACLPHT